MLALNVGSAVAEIIIRARPDYWRIAAQLVMACAGGALFAICVIG